MTKKPCRIAAALAGGVAVALAAGQDLHAAIPAPVEAALRTALDDEFKAEAFYDSVLARFGDVRPFTNIIRAEERHASVIASLMRRRGLSVPRNPYLAGAKSLPDVPASLGDACRMGITAEKENIALYERKLLPAVSDHPDIHAAFEALRDASRDRHLPAFTRCAKRRGDGPGPGKGKGRQLSKRATGASDLSGSGLRQMCEPARWSGHR